jgi:hypothetical protein
MNTLGKHYDQYHPQPPQPTFEEQLAALDTTPEVNAFIQTLLRRIAEFEEAEEARKWDPYGTY